MPETFCEACQCPTDDALCPACRDEAEEEARAETAAEFEELARLAAFARQLPCFI